MNKIIILSVILIAILGGAGYWVSRIPTENNPQTVPVKKTAPDPKNATYSIDGRPVTLINGMSEIQITPDSASKTITRYFGNETSGDFNNDGAIDIAFILDQNSGGTGRFYYVAALLSGANGYQGTEAMFLGDRIAPQTTEFRNGEIIVNYMDKKIGEGMSATPSEGVSRYFLVADGQLQEIKKSTSGTKAGATSQDYGSDKKNILSEAEARVIAETSCIKGGESMKAGIYNENSKTWWFDANLNATKPGCNPACVVNAQTGAVEINWRCTGLIPPENSDGSGANSGAACTMEAKICPDGSAVGRTGPNCEFAPCPASGITKCSAESRLREACDQIYAPVCARVMIQCIKAPCNPINQTFSNACAACANPLVESYTEGECKE